MRTQVATGTTPIEAPRQAADRLGWIGRTARTLRTRHQLAEMEPRMLADIGISRSDAALELARWPWDLGDRPRRR